MGVAITDILCGKKFDIKYLQNKIIAIDAYNLLYQFLTVLRGPDGAPLQNDEGKITSHLQGLLSRNAQFLAEGIYPLYIFDGEPPQLKKQERQRRRSLKEEAQKKYEISKERNDFEGMRKYASRMVRIDDEIISSTKRLLDCFGIPYLDAPSEGEAQAAFLVEQKQADFVVSQDADALLFGAPNVIRNLSLSGKRKVTGKLSQKTIYPMLYTLEATLQEYHISRKQLIALAMLTGTDFNIGGIKGLGPKKSLKLIKEKGEDFEELFKEVGWSNHFDIPWKEVMDIFLTCPVQKKVSFTWKDPSIELIKTFLVEEYGFSEERIQTNLDKLRSLKESKKQKGLGDFF